MGNGRVLGHEFCGEIVEMGGEVSGMAKGGRVVAVGTGGNAEFVRVPAAMTGGMMTVLDSVGDAEAATMEPLATSLHAANLGNAKDGETHLVMGAGIIGLGILQCIKARTNARVVVVDLSDKRLAKAEELGADETINAGQVDVVDQLAGTRIEEGNILDRIGEGTIDTVYDCAGMGKGNAGTSVLEQAINIVRENGRVVIVAVFEQDVTLDYNVLVRKGVTVVGSWTWSMAELAEAARMINNGVVDRTPLISHRFSLDQASDAYETQLMAEEAIKVVFTP